MHEPIVIIGLPRSGTSMVAGLFAEHGVFVGNCKPADERNPKGFFEHIGFTQLVIKHYGNARVSKGIPVNPMVGFRDAIIKSIEEDGYSDGPWLIKHATVWHRLWEEFHPKFVLVRRPSEDILSSIKNVGWKPRTEIIDMGQTILNELAKLPHAIQVESNSIVDGDFTMLKRAFEHCGLELNEVLVKGFVDSALWNRFSEQWPEGLPSSAIMRDRTYLQPNYKKGQKHA